MMKRIIMTAVALFFALILFSSEKNEVELFSCSFILEKTPDFFMIDSEEIAFVGYEEFFLPSGNHEISLIFGEEKKDFSFYTARQEETQIFFVPAENFFEITVESMNGTETLHNYQIYIFSLEKFNTEKTFFIKESLVGNSLISFPTTRIYIRNAIRLDKLFLTKLSVFLGEEEIYKKYYNAPEDRVLRVATAISFGSNIFFPGDLTIQMESDKKISIVDSDWFTYLADNFEGSVQLELRTLTPYAIIAKSFNAGLENMLKIELTEESTDLNITYTISNIDLGEPPFALYLFDENDLKIEILYPDKKNTELSF